MRFLRKEKDEATLLTPVKARLRFIQKLEGEITHFEVKLKEVETRLEQAEANVRQAARDKTQYPSLVEQLDKGISTEQNIILGFHSRIAEHRDAIEKRRKRILDLYDEIDCIQSGVELPDREEEPEKA